jgi:signal transduction histidine kinase
MLPSELARKGTWLPRAAVAAVIALFAIINVVAIYEMRTVEERNRLVVDNMLSSIQLVSRLGHDIDAERLYVHAHIDEKSPVERARIDRRMAGLKADFDDAARAYEATATEPGEQLAWDLLKQNAAALARPTQRALELSREGLSADARAVMRGAEDRFAAVNQDLEILVRINRAAADHAVTEVRSLHRSALIMLTLLTVAGIVLASTLGLFTMRLASNHSGRLLRASLLLEQRNRELDAFAGRVAHDLRGPLTTISIAGARLAERAPDEEGTATVLQRGVCHMEALIRDLLQLSRIDGQTRGFNCNTASVAALVDGDLRPHVQREGGLLQLSIEPAMVPCSEGLLRQALWNLGDNAIKYRRADAALRIAIHGRAAEGAYLLSVTDNGIGMTPAEARQVFDPFYRAQRSRDRPGTGLGLSIVKRVMEASGGSVEVRSQAGFGTTFLLRLPLARPEHRA